MQRHLITTANERTWVFDRPVLFLGEWCRRYDRRHVWSTMDAIVARPYGLEPGSRDRDVLYANQVTRKLLDEMVVVLNRIHSTDFGNRYWKIVIGHWLGRYVRVALNRYHCLDQALREHDVGSTSIVEKDPSAFIPQDSKGFAWAMNGDAWNHAFYSSILRFRGGIEIFQLPADALATCDDQHGNKMRGKGDSPNWSQIVKSALSAILSFFSRDGDAFNLNSYLPLRKELALQFLFGQIPQIWRAEPYEASLPHFAMRAGIELDVDGLSGFERYIRTQLPWHMPSCYLEGYQKLVKAAENVRWPKCPKVIFTSNNYDMDEVFKVWVGKRVLEGCRYCIGQHGNNYGTMKGIFSFFEIEMADRFLTWGWSDSSPSVRRAAALKLIGRSAPKWAPQGDLLLVERQYSPRIGPQDDYFPLIAFHEEQFRFVNTLPNSIRERLTVRILPPTDDSRLAILEQWADMSPTSRLELGDANIWDLVGASRLVVHSYDSTGMLETLALNFPTVCFWQVGFDHLTSSSIPFYEELKSVGIIHFSALSAAQHIAQHWEDIQGWWTSEEVQTARLKFCNEYARLVRSPLTMLKQVLLGD